MEPLIKSNDTLLVSGLPYLFKNPKINDIVALREKGNKMLIKRITKIHNDKYFVQGDNLKDSYDSRKFGEIFKNQILGKVIYFFPSHDRQEF